jgi:DNA-directed RNA polymerase subunit RPC12/RpoP
MSTSLIYHTQVLREYKYISTEFYGSEVHITIEQKKEFLRCVNCGSKNISAVKRKTRKIKGLPVGTKKTIFLVRILCLKCFIAVQQNRKQFPVLR